MAETKNIRKIVDRLLNLQNAYASTYRAVITKERHQSIPWQETGASFVECPVLREPLLEHVGHLPIIATYLHPLLASSSEVNLGRALTMLAIHDIGETIVGDVPSFAKNSQHEHQEREAASLLLSSELALYYEEYEQSQSLDAKFAKSIDTLSPMLHHLSHLDTLAVLYQHLNADLITLWERKRTYMTWDKLILDIFDYCTTTIKPTLFANREDTKK